MAKRDPETDVRAFLGTELARARVASGFSSQDVLAAKLGFDRSVIGKAETGDRPPTPEVLAAWCEACGLDTDHFERLARLARRADGPVPAWFETWLEAEREAQVLRDWAPIIVTPLFHTAAYARALLVKVQTDVSDETLGAMVAAKLGRRAIFDRPEPPDMTAILDESVLHRLIGSPEIMTEQLAFVAELAARPCITVQIVPAGNGANAGLAGPLSIASGDTMPDVLHTDAIPEGVTSETRTTVRRAGVAFDRVRADALPRGASQEMIMEAAEQWKTQAN